MNKSDVFLVDELLAMNEYMLGRGMPVQDDGVGYNKADYSVCSNYYHGLSNAQIADLARRLVKYSETQLHIDKELMKETAKYYESLVKDGQDRNNGVSISVMEEETLISFKYNEDFINVIRKQPKRRWDSESKQWVVPNNHVIKVLKELEKVGADVENAINYAMNHELIINAKPKKVDVLLYFDEDAVLMKFDYNEEILKRVKKIDKKYRKWNPQHKYWEIANDEFKLLMQSLKPFVNFKVIKQG